MSKVISKIVVPDSSEVTGYALYNVKDANAIPASEKGAVSGVATLDNTGKIPSSQIPSSIVSLLSDWNQIDSTAGDYIKNKPTIPSVGNAEIEIQKNGTKVGSFTTNQSGSKVTMNITVPTGTAANKDVPTSGNASTSQVVMGSDSRLTDSRNAKDVYRWAKASSKPTYTASEVGAIPTSAKGAASGVATLDSAGKVPSSQLPSYVDDVLEYDTKSDFPTTGEAGKIYVDKSTNTTWRWSGSAYTQIKGDLVIGTTSGTAADGGVANTHYNNTSNPHSVTKSQVGLGSVVNTGDSATPVSGGTTKFTTGGAYTELAKKVDKVSGKGLSTNDYTTDEKNKLAGIASGAEVNQNAFSNVVVGSTTISADGKTDSITLVAGSNVTLTPDATNDKITIAATDTKYTAATAAPGKVASSSVQGSSTNYARQDHTHGIDLATGDSNGQVKIAGTNVSVKGLRSAAYTASSAYAANQQLASDANLNNIKTVGFYNACGGNTITNKPSGVEHFGMEVIHYAAGDYYVQIVYNNSNSWRRRCDNGTWGSWVQDKLTDTTYSSKAAASGGTNVSLVTTGEKYTWNNKLSSIQAAAGSHINEAGTPNVTASTASGVTTFTFDYLKGPKGDKGDTGTAGEKGEKGDTGATGPLGPAGTNGTTPTIKAAAGSAIGSVGTPSVSASTSGTTTTFTFNYLKGATGATGPLGPQGPKGDTGAKGDKGNTGATGATGAKGPQGPAGKDGLTTSVKVNGSTYTQSGGIITLPNYPSNYLTAASFINNNKGTSVGKIMVADASNGLGYSTPSNLASVLGGVGVLRNIGSITSIEERPYSYIAYAKGIDNSYYGQLLYLCSSPDGHGVPFVLMGDAFQGKLRYKAKTTSGWSDWKIIV